MQLTRSAGKGVRTRLDWSVGFTPDWMKKWRQFFKPIVYRSDAKPIIFRHSNENRSINGDVEIILLISKRLDLMTVYVSFHSLNMEIGLLAVWRPSRLINKPFCRRVAVFTFLWFAGFFPVTSLTTFIDLTMLKPLPANPFPRPWMLSCSLLASG